MASTNDFEKLWKQAQNEPAVRKVPAEKINVDLKLEHLLDSFLDHAAQGLAQKKISRAAFDDLSAQTKLYKAALTKVKRVDLDAGKKPALKKQKGKPKR